MAIVKEKADLGLCSTCDSLKLVTVIKDKALQKAFMCYSYARRPFLIVRSVDECYGYKAKWEKLKLPKKIEPVTDNCIHSEIYEIKNRNAKRGRKVYLCDRKEGKRIILVDLSKCVSCPQYSRKV